VKVKKTPPKPEALEGEEQIPPKPEVLEGEVLDCKATKQSNKKIN
jgi:hypothetical protein